MDIAIDFAYEHLIPGLTKFAVSAINHQLLGDTVAFGSHVFQRSRSIGFLRAFATEWGKACKEHRVEEKYLETEAGQMSIQELFDYLDKDLPDEKKFDCLKRIFFRGAENTKSNGNDNYSLHYIRLCRQLSSEELLILGVCFKSRKIGKGREHISAIEWPKLVAEYSGGLLTRGVVEFYERQMIEHKLIGERSHSDRSGIVHGSEFRLTPLGIEVAEYITKLT